MLNILCSTLHPNFFYLPDTFQSFVLKHVVGFFSIRMENSVDPDQISSSEVS